MKNILILVGIVFLFCGVLIGLDLEFDYYTDKNDPSFAAPTPLTNVIDPASTNIGNVYFDAQGRRLAAPATNTFPPPAPVPKTVDVLIDAGLTNMPTPLRLYLWPSGEVTWK